MKNVKTCQSHDSVPIETMPIANWQETAAVSTDASTDYEFSPNIAYSCQKIVYAC
jgi:hypothetical protein